MRTPVGLHAVMHFLSRVAELNSLTVFQGVPHNLGPRPQATSTAISMGPVLFGSRSSRSPLVEWMLVETKTEYTHKEERNGLPNPFGQIPGFIDGSVEVRLSIGSKSRSFV